MANRRTSVRDGHPLAGGQAARLGAEVRLPALVVVRLARDLADFAVARTHRRRLAGTVDLDAGGDFGRVCLFEA